MIEKEYTFGTVTFYCDISKCKSEHYFDRGVDSYPDIDEASKDAREFGWIIFKEDGYWWHYCSKECKIKVNYHEC